jgi:hypothetical protein
LAALLLAQRAGSSEGNNLVLGNRALQSLLAYRLRHNINLAAEDVV